MFLSRFLINKPNALSVKSYKKIGGKKRILLLFLSSGDLTDSAEFDDSGVHVHLRGGVSISKRKLYYFFLVGVFVSELPEAACLCL